MANDSPDWVEQVQVIVEVAGEAYPSEYDFDDIVDKLDEIWTAFLADTKLDVESILATIIANWAEEKGLWFPTTETPINGYGKKTTTSSSYQEVTSWTVSSGKTGVLSKIELACNNYTVTQWRVTVVSVKVLDDDYLPSRMSKDFADMRLAAGTEVKVEVKSDGSTSITAYADIDAKEVS